ncbi:MAG: hypothetical protein KDA30_15380, partial [Phycisphaerales bacterium]|nr:hypothetical protein [Phycisphaerales bacterium]
LLVMTMKPIKPGSDMLTMIRAVTIGPTPLACSRSSSRIYERDFSAGDSGCDVGGASLTRTA